MNKKLLSMSSFFISFLYFSEIHCNVIWPAAIVGSEIIKSLNLIVISVAIEALLLYIFIKNISCLKALLISCIGNAASAFVGSIMMAIAMLLWHIAFDSWLGGTFNSINLIATYFFMYLGTSFIELFTIKILFRYSTKLLWIPIFSGNLITYFLVFIFKLWQQI